MQYQNATAQPREELNDVIIESVTTDSMFAGIKILPPKPMNLPVGHVPKILVSSGNLMRAARKKRSPGANFDRWQSAISDLTITLVQMAEEILLPDEQTLIYEDYFAFETVYASEAANRIRRAHEIECEVALFDSGTFTATAATVAYTAANIATMDPATDILAALRRIKAAGESANTIVIPGQVYDRIRLATLFKNWIAGSIYPGYTVSEDGVQSSFTKSGITQVVVADSYMNESDEGNSDVINPIWPNTYIWVGNVQSGELKAGGVGRTFFWEKEGPIFNIQSYRDETRKSNVIRAIKTTLAAITNSRAGQLITTNYA